MKNGDKVTGTEEAKGTKLYGVVATVTREPRNDATAAYAKDLDVWVRFDDQDPTQGPNVKRKRRDTRFYPAKMVRLVKPGEEVMLRLEKE